jgi:F5/8 type C domain
MLRAHVRSWVAALTVSFITALASRDSFAAETAFSEWVHPGADGKLVYKTTSAGDRIMDFSYAGYMAGGVALPNVPVKKTVEPSGDSGKDDTATIQAAIDEIAKLPLVDGFRGAVQLGPGDFTCASTINIRDSGIVLRGSGSGLDGKPATTIKMVGGKHAAIVISSARGRQAAGPSVDDNEPAAGREPTRREDTAAARTTISDAYVPSGTTSFNVADATGFAAGDTISIRRPTTAAWVKFMEMDNLKRDGKAQTWIGLSRSGITERKITAINGKKLTLDIPLADSYNAEYLNPPGTAVTKIRAEAAINHVGVEHLHIQCPPLEIAYGQAPYSAIRIGGDDCFVRDVYCEETMNSTVLSGKRITMQEVVVTHTYANLGASKPTDFSIEGSQILLDRCKITGGNMYFVWTASLKPGPNVILNCTFRGQGSRVQPHMRWSTGLLVDNCSAPDGGIDLMNRGVMGSGHGWTMGWGVAWNCGAKNYVIQYPPGAANWAIGCIGEQKQTARPFDASPLLPEGMVDSQGTHVAPHSLYLAQLEERMGKSAIEAIGYSARPDKEFVGALPKESANLYAATDRTLGPDLAVRRPINSSNVRNRAREFGGEKAVDGDDQTYWATNDGAARAVLEVDMEGPVQINAAEIGEAIGHESNVQDYKIEGQVDSDWKLLAKGTTIGERKVDLFPSVTVWKVKLTILKAQPYAAIRKFGLYLADRSAVEDTPSAAAATASRTP